MKATLLLLVVVAAIFSSVYADWTISTLENGVYVTGIATSISTQDCHYAKLTVPAGTTHVQIDVETSESNYVSVTGGFNVAPAADRSGLNSYSFSDNNVILGSPRRYLMCTFNPMASFGASNNIAFGSVNSGTTCAAFLPNMQMGGDVYVCLSSYSSPSVNVSIAISHHNATTVGTMTDAQTITIPATSGSATADQMAWAFNIYVPTNATYIAMTTGSSSVVVRTVGLWTNGYTSGNSLYQGDYQSGVWHTLIVVSDSGAADVVTFSVTNSCDGWVQGGPNYSSSVATCYDIMNATIGAQMSFDGSASYYLYRVWIPQIAPFFAFNATFNTTAGWTGYVSFNGASFFSLDTSVNAAGGWSTQNQDYISGTDFFSAVHYIAGGSWMNVVLDTSSSNPGDVHFIIGQEMQPGVFPSASVLTGDAPVNVATPVSSFILQNFTVEEGKAVNISVSSASSFSGFIVVTSSFAPVTQVGLGSIWTSASIYMPSLPAGDYIMIVSPYSTGAQSVDFSMMVTDAPSDSAAGVATYSLVVLLVSMIAALLF